MPNLVPLVTVIVRRGEGTDSKRVKPEIGKVFSFTDAEVKDIKAVNPDALRKPINESGGEGGGNGGGSGASPDAGKTDEQIVAETKDVVKGLIGDTLDVIPNMDNTNKALKAAGLPSLKAEQRDAIIAEIKADAEL